MLKKIIAALLCYTMLVNPSMIASAEESNAENSVVTTDADTEKSDQETSPIGAEDPVEVGRAIREKLDVDVAEVISFDEGVLLEDIYGRALKSDYWEKIWVIGAEDGEQRFRVYVPRIYTYEEQSVVYLRYENVKDAKHEEDEGISIADMHNDGHLDVFDMVLMRRGFIYGWDQDVDKVIADVNADGQVSISDLVKFQRWLLGADDSF